MEKKDLISARVISTNLSRVLSEMKNQTDETEAKLAVSRFRLECSYEDFLRLLGQAARHILLQMGNRRKFVIDDFNEPTIRQLHLYLSRNPDFSGDLDKG